MAAIAEQAQVSKANIFHHYKSKQALYREVMRFALADSARSLDDLEQAQGTLPERVHRFARDRLASYIDQPQAMRLILRELTQEGPESGLHLVREDFMKSYTRMVNLIRSDQEKGLVRSGPHPGVIALMVSAANIFFAQIRPGMRQFPDTDYLDDPDAFCAMVMDIVFNGVMASSRPLP